MFNFKYGEALAIQQGEYFKKYKEEEKITKKQLSDMEQNLWVLIASKIAPNNLVIRQWCLIDLFKNEDKHSNKILNILETLSYKSIDIKLYAEGYSYFCYVMEILDEWLKKFPNIFIKKVIEEIELGFIKTSYKNDNDGRWYPALFGDLWEDSSLKEHLQINHKIENIEINPIRLKIENDLIKYEVKGMSIGLNNHIEKDDAIHRVINGFPYGFKFYQGYKNKYKNKKEELKDIFSFKRIKSAFLKG